MQADAVHEAIHDEGGAGHVARVFHERDEEVKQQDVGQEDGDAAHAADDAVGQQVAQGALGHPGADEIAEPTEGSLDPVLRELAELKGGRKREPHEEDEDGEAEPLVRHDAVDAVGGAVHVVGAGGVGFAEGAGDVAVFAVDDGGLDALAEQSVERFRASFGCGLPLREGCAAAQGALRFGVALEELQRPVARGELVGQVVAVLHEAGEGGQLGLDGGAVVDVHLALHAVAAFEDVDDCV